MRSIFNLTHLSDKKKYSTRHYLPLILKKFRCKCLIINSLIWEFWELPYQKYIIKTMNWFTYIVLNLMKNLMKSSQTSPPFYSLMLLVYLSLYIELSLYVACISLYVLSHNSHFHSLYISSAGWSNVIISIFSGLRLSGTNAWVLPLTFYTL